MMWFSFIDNLDKIVESDVLPIIGLKLPRYINSSNFTFSLRGYLLTTLEVQ